MKTLDNFLTGLFQVHIELDGNLDKLNDHSILYQNTVSKMEKKRHVFWLSWFQPTDDYRPLTFPPNEMILGWWKTGERGSDGTSTMVALVIARGRESAMEGVKLDWPEVTEWRFCVDVDTINLSDRFPVKDWMSPRLERAAIILRRNP